MSKPSKRQLAEYKLKSIRIAKSSGVKTYTAEDKAAFAASRGMTVAAAPTPAPAPVKRRGPRGAWVNAQPVRLKDTPGLVEYSHKYCYAIFRSDRFKKQHAVRKAYEQAGVRDRLVRRGWAVYNYPVEPGALEDRRALVASAPPEASRGPRKLSGKLSPLESWLKETSQCIKTA